MAGRVYLNFLRTKLTGQLLAAGSSCTITTGDGTLFSPVNFAGGEYVICILRHQSGYADAFREVVKVTNRSTDTLTITRAQESTSAAQFEIGDWLDLDVTAASFSALSGMTTGFIDGETPSGTVDGSNATFTLANSPGPATSLRLFLNGLRQRLTTDYSLSGNTITYTTGAKPQSGDNHIADYRY